MIDHNSTKCPPDGYWIWACRKIGSYPAPTQWNGKWLIYVPTNELEKSWRIIKDNVEKGHLGNYAKTTKKPHQDRSPNIKPIVVYTYDYRDREDVIKIRQELYRIGFTSPISYKTDDATRNRNEIRKYADEGYVCVFQDEKVEEFLLWEMETK